MDNIKKLIVIVGSGFAGINAAIQLRKVNSNLSILVIDSKSQFEFKPLLYKFLAMKFNHGKLFQVLILFLLILE